MRTVTASLSRLSPEQVAREAAGHADPETLIRLYDTAAGPERAADARHMLASKIREAAR